jgi:hypothetical protein
VGGRKKPRSPSSRLPLFMVKKRERRGPPVDQRPQILVLIGTKGFFSSLTYPGGEDNRAEKVSQITLYWYQERQDRTIQERLARVR